MPFDEAETFTKHNAEPLARWRYEPVKRIDDNNFELTVPASWFEIEEEDED